MSNNANRDPRRVREMFGAIARRYDLLNHLLSLNLDRSWRRRVVRELGPAADGRILDVCGGTGDLTAAIAGEVSRGVVVCCDFSRPMLEIACGKFRRRGIDDRCLALEADGLRLPFASGCFDAVTVAFGVRNFADMDLGFRESLRVLRSGGRLLVLEFSKPSAPVLASVYRFYLGRIIPLLGDRVSRQRGPYGYLAATIADFPDPHLLAGRIREAGFAAVGWTTLTGGIVALHTAIKSPQSPLTAS